ncbi:MAG TPA: NADH-quinone oxidoreductase subunit NuoN [Candidatus Bathyarchaeia archaeon]|nr:NADH-quinone oxidoreductase subunit NuoN [Candidatus Bathyarchaeia archaeon]
MEVKDIFSYNWSYLLPEFTILGFATILSLLDLAMGKRSNRAIIGWLSLLGVIIAGVFITLNMVNLNEPVSYMADMMRVDDFGNAFKLIFLAGVACTLVLSLAYMKYGEISNQSEYYYLLLTALLGAMVMASSADLITLFVGLELLSLSSFVLVGLRKKSLLANEASFKYVVSGGIATAFTLFGMSYMYGLSGTTNLYVMTERLAEAYNGGYGFLVLLSFAFVLVGISFKISAVPNHLWAPDVYQGAATPVTAFLAVVSKAAGFALVLRLLVNAYIGLISPEGQSVLLENLSLILSTVAALSMIIGNTMALRQTNVKRMMAYSGVAQAGYLLVPFATLTNLFFEQTVFYLIAYLLASFGAFAVLMVVFRDQETEELKSFAGLYHRSPIIAIAMTLFMLSFAGIPVSVGFFGKFYLFMSAILQKHYWLSAIMMGTSVISYFYYFGIIRQMYMRPGNTEAELRVPTGVAVIIAILALATLVFGIVPGALFDFVQANFNPNFDIGNMMTPGK